MQELMQNPEQIMAILASLVGVASALSALIRVVAKVTPNEADDQFASRMSRFVGKLQKILDRLAMNPDASKARKK